MFSLGRSMESLRTVGTAKIDFTENTYVIRLQLVGDQVQLTSSRGVPTPHPSCSFDEYASEIRSFITDGVEYLELHYPALARNPAMSSLRELAAI